MSTSPSPRNDTALLKLVDALRRGGHHPVPDGDGWKSRCPYCHGVLQASADADGRLILQCSISICTPEEVLHAASCISLPLAPKQAIILTPPSAQPPVMIPAPWPALRAFDEDVLPPFPVEALPPILREWVVEEAHATQTPPDLAAWLSLATVAATIARRFVVDAERFTEPTNIFAVVLLEPGNRKSAVFGDALRPLKEVEAELIEASRGDVARRQSERRQLTERLKKKERAAASSKPADAASAAAEATELAMKLDEFIEPVLPRLIVDNATSEKLEMLLHAHGGRIASMSPEGGVFDLMAGKYSKSGADFEVYLKGHAGDDLRVDRVTRAGLSVTDPALTCGYAVQPAVIAGVARRPEFRGRGLLGRFMYAMPYSLIGRRKIATPPVSPVVSEQYRQVIRRLAQSTDEGLLVLSAEASRAQKEWEAEVEVMLDDGGVLEAIRDWGGKLVGATIRIAASLHAAEHAFDSPLNSPISTETFAAAVTIARYAIPHADAVLSMMDAGNAKVEIDARYVLKWIKRRGERMFSQRDAHQHGKRQFPKVADLNHALKELSDRNYIRLVPPGPARPGRPPSSQYEVNPTLLANGGSDLSSQYSQNPTIGPSMASFGNIEDASSEKTTAADPSADPEGGGREIFTL